MLESTLYLTGRGTGGEKLPPVRRSSFFREKCCCTFLKCEEEDLTKRRNDSEERILERIRRVFNVRLEGNPETHPKKSRGGHPPRRTNPPRNLETGSRFVSLEMGDDAALVRPARGWEMVLTCDWFLQGTHFLRDKHPADAVGWKCLARAPG